MTPLYRHLPGDYRQNVRRSPGIHESSFKRISLSPIFNRFRCRFPFNSSNVTLNPDKL